MKYFMVIAVGCLLAAMQLAHSAQINVYILTGQSNSLGTTGLESPFAPGSDAADAQTQFFWSNVRSTNTGYPPVRYGDSASSITTLQEQQGDGGVNPTFWGPEIGLARRLYEHGERNTLVIKASRGGGGNTYWDQAAFEANAGSGHMWGHLRDTVDAGLAAIDPGDTFSVRGFMYLQGESNSASEAAIADTRLRNLVDNLKTHINASHPGTATDMHAVVGEIAASGANANRVLTTQLQTQLAAAEDEITFVATSDLPLKSDGIHFGRDAKLTIGQRFADAFLAIREQPNGISGDVNQDGVLSTGSGDPATDDVAALLAGWRTTTEGLTNLQKNLAGDLDLNGTTDLADAFLLHSALELQGQAFAFDEIQLLAEPQAALLLVGGVGLLLAVSGRSPRLNSVATGCCLATCIAAPNARAQNSLAEVSIHCIDLAGETDRQVIVDREPGQYLGHPTTVLLEDGKTLLTVYPKGHGRGGIVLKRSDDGGLTWSDRLPTPASWATSKETPTIHRVVDAAGAERLIVWSGLYPARLSVSEDDGATWSELKKAGDWGGIVVMGFVEPLAAPGHYLAMFHDDGRFISADAQQASPPVFTLYQTRSTDGGLTWSQPEAIWSGSDVHLCEPGCIRSPDGRQLAVLLRENRRVKNSHIMFSDDEGESWSEPRELPLALTGDRHTGKYAPDGRLLISFRCISPRTLAATRPFEGDWVGWVGTYDDLVNGAEGQYQIRLADNTQGYDTAYPGVEVLPDGTFVVTTYGQWTLGEPPYILSVRLQLAELDRIAAERPGSW